MSVLERLAFAIHEADLGRRCEARGPERQKHVQAYLPTAVKLIESLSRRWEPRNPPEDVR